MKKFVAFILAAMMLLSLAACGNQSAPAATTAVGIAGTVAPPSTLNMASLLHLAARRLGLSGEKPPGLPPPALPKSAYVCVLICDPEVAVKQASHLPGVMLRDSAQVLCPSDLKRKHAPFFLAQ